MVIVSNCLTEQADEGCLKVANSLIKRVKKLRPETTVITYGRESVLSDRHLNLNKLMLSRELIRLLRQKREPVLYVPSLTRTLPMAVRTFILSRFARWGMAVIMVAQTPLDRLTRLLIKFSGVNIITLSKTSWSCYNKMIGNRAKYLKVGVDTEQFRPVSREKKTALREKYGIPEDRLVVLHVGHMKQGRNVGHLTAFDDRFHSLLVVSTLTSKSFDHELKQHLVNHGITVVDTFCPNIEEYYQLSDVYFFPVTDPTQCIDSPLSVMEAAACGLPIVTTPFGELAELMACEGFYPIGSFEPEQLNMLLERACKEEKDTRPSILEYDWEIAVERLLEFCK